MKRTKRELAGVKRLELDRFLRQVLALNASRAADRRKQPVWKTLEEVRAWLRYAQLRDEAAEEAEEQDIETGDNAHGWSVADQLGLDEDLSVEERETIWELADRLDPDFHKTIYWGNHRSWLV